MNKCSCPPVAYSNGDGQAITNKYVCEQVTSAVENKSV